MTYFFISDLHVDFHSPLSRTVSLLRQYFEEFFKRYFLPADVCCIAGDIANNYFTYVEFLKFIATKYSAVYVCFGNHDIITERAGVFGTEKDFPTSEGKMDFFLKESAKIQMYSIRLKVKTVESIKRKAAVAGIPYQTYVNVLLDNAASA